MGMLCPEAARGRTVWEIIATVLVLWTGGWVEFDKPHDLDEHSMMPLAQTSTFPHNSDASHIREWRHMKSHRNQIETIARYRISSKPGWGANSIRLQYKHISYINNIHVPTACAWPSSWMPVIALPITSCRHRRAKVLVGHWFWVLSRNIGSETDRLRVRPRH